MTLAVGLVAGSCSGGGNAPPATPTATGSVSAPTSPTAATTPTITSGIDRVFLNSLHVQRFAPVDVGADSSIAAGFGGVWVTSGRQLVEFDPDSGTQLSTVSLDESGGAIVSGHEWLWLIDGSPGSGALHPTVVAVDPASGEIAAQSPDQSRGLAALADGNEGVWATNPASGTVVELDPITARERHTYHVDSSPGAGTISARFGQVLVIDHETGSLTSIDESTGKVHRGRLGGTPYAIAFGDNGIWFTDNENGVVVDLPPSGKVKPVPLQVGAGPIAVGEGAVWVGSIGGDTLWRIDQRTRKVQTILLDGPPVSIAVGEGAVWVLYS